MSYIDIAIIALAVLFGLFGVLRGVKRSALSLGAFLVAFLLAFFLANVVAEALIGIDGIRGFVLGDGVGEGSSWSLAKLIYGGLDGSQSAGLGEDTFLYKNFFAPIIEIVNGANVEVDPLVGGSMYLAFIMFSALCGIGIYIIARFLLVIVTTIVKGFIGRKKSVLSRLLGFVVGAVRGGLWALTITLIFSCFGGLTFITPIAKVENEYEHPNAVLCSFVNESAYSIRNKLFLPDADMYGRIVNSVYKPSGGGDPDSYPRKQAELIVNVGNLNYGGDAWWITDANEFGLEENGKVDKYAASDFYEVGFDELVQTLLDYNKAALEKAQDRSLGYPDSKLDTLNGFIKTNSTNLEKLTTDFINYLRAYKANFLASKELPSDTDPNAYDTTVLESSYVRAKTALEGLVSQYRYVTELFGDVPDFNAMVPARKHVNDPIPERPVTPTPEPDPDPDTGDEGGEVTPPDTGDEGGEVTPPDTGDEGGEVTPPDTGDEGGEVTPPEPPAAPAE